MSGAGGHGSASPARAPGTVAVVDPLDTRRADPRYQRLMAATREAAGRGYDEVSMRALAKATRMSLTTIYQYCSSKDHLTNSVAWGPDGALYFTQGSNSAMGAPDNAWANRLERQLNGAVLRLDTSKLPGTLPLDVKTVDGGGTYNPFATNAALTIFGSGVRNAYDLVWHSNVPVCGSNRTMAFAVKSVSHTWSPSST